MRYEKGRRDATRRRIMEVAGERLRKDGIAATGLAGIMSDAGLTNGAFYPHFKSKAELVRETVATALEEQASQIQDSAASRGVEATINAYLSPGHRDTPGAGCTLSALLPELAREPVETRAAWADGLMGAVRHLASALPPQADDREEAAIAIYAMLVGSLQLARAVAGTELSDRILAVGAHAAQALAERSPAKQDR